MGYPHVVKSLAQLADEVVTLVDQQRIERWILVVPAPAPSQFILVLERAVGIEVAIDGSDVQLSDGLSYGCNVSPAN